MELTPVTYLIVLPLVFLAGFVDSVAGGGGIISLPAYLMAGIPAHLAAGTNKVVNGTGTLVAALKYFRSGKVLLRPAIVSGIGALLGAAIGTKIALLINEDILKTMMLVALPCAAILLMSGFPGDVIGEASLDQSHDDLLHFGAVGGPGVFPIIEVRCEKGF